MRASLKGEFNDAGVFVAAADPAPSAGAFEATVGNLRGTFRGRIAVGVIGVIGTIAIVAFAFEKWNRYEEMSLSTLLFGSRGTGWISVVLDVWFFSWLLKQKAGEEKAAAPEAGEERSTLSGLSPECIKIRRQLLTFQSTLNCYVLPEIDANLLSLCRKCCNVPAEERILGLVDFSGNEDGDNVLLVGCQGIYFFNYKKSAQAGPRTIPYREFSERSLVNHGNEVYLGNDQFLYLDPDYEVDCEAVTNLLNAIRDIVLERTVKPEK